MYFDRVTARKDLQFYVFMEAFGLKGSKKFMHPLAEGLVEKGYVAVCSNYRLTDVAPAPAQLHDVFSAIRSFVKMPPIMGLIQKRLE